MEVSKVAEVTVDVPQHILELRTEYIRKIRKRKKGLPVRITKAEQAANAEYHRMYRTSNERRHELSKLHSKRWKDNTDYNSKRDKKKDCQAVSIDSKVFVRLKAVAQAQGVSMRSIVNQCVSEYVRAYE